VRDPEAALGGRGCTFGLTLGGAKPGTAPSPALEIPTHYPDIWDRTFSVGTQEGVAIPLIGYRNAIAVATPVSGKLPRMRLADSPKEHSHMGILTLQIFGTAALFVGHLFVVVRNRLVR
jgi:hypothetical protein